MVVRPGGAGRVRAKEDDRSLDHTNLNTLECFLDQVPTTENLCMRYWRIFADCAPACEAGARSRRRDGNNSFEYFGDELATSDATADCKREDADDARTASMDKPWPADRR